MDIKINSYLINAIKVIRENIFLLSIPAIIGILIYIPLYSKGKPGSFFILSMLLLFIVYPLVYGQYAEIIITGGKISYLKIFNTHWFNYIIVNILIGSPIILIILFDTFLMERARELVNIFTILIHVLGIYIIPLVFLLRKRLLSISLGIKCLLGNFSFSLPLIILTLFPSIFGLVIRNPSGTSEYSLTYLLFSYVFLIISHLLDFIIFVAATLILKEKLLKGQVELEIIG